MKKREEKRFKKGYLSEVRIVIKNCGLCLTGKLRLG